MVEKNPPKSIKSIERGIKEVMSKTRKKTVF